MNRPHVLLSAYQCGPGMGSVSQIGWEWYSRLSCRVPVTLVTHIRNRLALVAAGAPLNGSAIHYIDTEWFAGPLYRTASAIFRKSQHAVFLVSSLDYFPYDREAFRLLKRLKSTAKWDLVHAVTPVSPAGATRLHRLGLPVVLGPWNGGLQSPSTFPEIMRADSGWLYQIRDVGKHLDAALGTTAHSAAILSANQATDLRIGPKNRGKSIRMIENGVNLDVFTADGNRPPPSEQDPLRIIFTGRLVPFKGVGMLLEAVSRIRSEFQVELTIVGDGPLKDELIAAAEQFKIPDLVHFTGNLPLPEVAAAMRRADVFCLPSVRESGGAVLLEAMASGIPVLAVNYGGPAEIVSSEFGRLLSAEGKQQVIQDLTQAFRDIKANPLEWRAKGCKGRAAAEKLYGWDSKIDQALTIYMQILNQESKHA